MTRERSKRVARGQRGERLAARGRDREVKAVRNRRAAGGRDVILVFRVGRPLRVTAEKLANLVRRGRGRR